MKLETHERRIADPATAADVARVVPTLTEVDEAFVLLIDGVDDDETYIQAAGTVGEAFIVEYRDGGVAEHYRGDRRVSADELVALFTGYLRRAPDWSGAITWHRVRFGQEAPSA